MVYTLKTTVKVIHAHLFSFSFSICTLFECTGQKMRSFCDFEQPFLWDDGYLSTPRFDFGEISRQATNNKLLRSEEEIQAIRTEEDFLARIEKKRQKAALKAVQQFNFV